MHGSGGHATNLQHDFVKAAHRLTVVVRLRCVAWPNAEERLDASGTGRPKFFRDVGDEEQLVRRLFQFAHDALVALSRALGPNGGVEETGEAKREVAVLGGAKEHF